MTSAPPADLRFRRPTAADHARVASVVDEWWGERPPRSIVRTAWFRHFTGTSWIAETSDGRLVGFLLGFVSPDHPLVAEIVLAGVLPARRREGVGSELYRRFTADVGGQGVRRVEAWMWPANRSAIAFHRALGFEPDDGGGTMPLYGTPAYPDHEGPGEDRTRMVLALP